MKSLKLAIAAFSVAALAAVTPMQSAKAHPVAVPVVVGLVALGVVGGIVVGAKMAHARQGDGYIPMKYRGDKEYGYRANGNMGKCAAKFKSFNPNTGMVVGADGARKACPYLVN
jgi:hypothetical protein